MLVTDNASEPKLVKRTFSRAKLSKLFLKICGVPDHKVSAAVEISIQSRKNFLTETSDVIRKINVGFAVLLIFVIMFLVIYYH